MALMSSTLGGMILFFKLHFERGQIRVFKMTITTPTKEVQKGCRFTPYASERHNDDITTTPRRAYLDLARLDHRSVHSLRLSVCFRDRAS
jgi:hypothetical protein